MTEPRTHTDIIHGTIEAILTYGCLVPVWCDMGHYEEGPDGWDGYCLDLLLHENPNTHPYAPENDDPDARCGDCNERGDHEDHDHLGTDYRYWPEDLRP